MSGNLNVNGGEVGQEKEGEMSELTIPAWRDDEGIGTLQDDEPESYCPNCAYDLPCDGKCKYWRCANEDLPLFPN